MDDFLSRVRDVGKRAVSAFGERRGMPISTHVFQVGSDTSERNAVEALERDYCDGLLYLADALKLGRAAIHGCESKPYVLDVVCWFINTWYCELKVDGLDVLLHHVFWLLLRECDGDANTIDSFIDGADPLAAARLYGRIDIIVNSMIDVPNGGAESFVNSVVRHWTNEAFGELHSLTVIDFLGRVRRTDSSMPVYRNSIVVEAAFCDNILGMHVAMIEELLERRYGLGAKSMIYAAFFS